MKLFPVLIFSIMLVLQGCDQLRNDNVLKRQAIHWKYNSHGIGYSTTEIEGHTFLITESGNSYYHNIGPEVSFKVE